jgi:hypothetical protein
MQASQFFGTLIPSHPDFQPIIQAIREKYQLPEARPEDDITQVLLTNYEIDWDGMPSYPIKSIKQ